MKALQSVMLEEGPLLWTKYLNCPTWESGELKVTWCHIGFQKLCQINNQEKAT